MKSEICSDSLTNCQLGVSQLCLEQIWHCVMVWLLQTEREIPQRLFCCVATVVTMIDHVISLVWLRGRMILII